MHQLNTDRQDIMRHRDRYLEPLEHPSFRYEYFMSSCSVGSPRTEKSKASFKRRAAREVLARKT